MCLFYRGAVCDAQYVYMLYNSLRYPWSCLFNRKLLSLTTSGLQQLAVPLGVCRKVSSRKLWYEVPRLRALIFFKMLGKITYSHMKINFWPYKILYILSKKTTLRYGKIILLSYFWLFCKTNLFLRNSIPFRASEWALPRNSECPRNAHFLPRNNGIHSESIPRNFFGTKFRCQP